MYEQASGVLFNTIAATIITVIMIIFAADFTVTVAITGARVTCIFELCADIVCLAASTAI